MKATKTKAGTWRALAFYVDEDGNRRRKSFTASTKRDAEALANSFTLNKKARKTGNMTLEQAIDEYIELKTNVLSPTTIYTYKYLRRNYPSWLISKNIADITKKDIDTFIEGLAAYSSPKTVRNYYTFLRAVFRYNDIKMDYHRLPQRKRIEYIIPTKAEVDQMIEYAKEKNDDQLYLAIILGAYACMRRGEICGLTPKDVKGNTVHIHNNRVSCEGGTVIKDPKNITSDRIIEVPNIVAEALKGRKSYVTVTPRIITKKFKQAVIGCGLDERMHLHNLRHFCASYLHAEGRLPNQFIQEYGGWANSHILESVYRHTLSDYRQSYNDRLNDIF